MKALASHTDRLGAFSDAVIAVIITIMVLDLKAPDAATFSALGALGPTAISYAVSYLFIAIIWVNHHYLLQLVRQVTNRLLWLNFAHLFVVALLPFATSWIAKTSLASAPVVIYAAIFVCVNLAFIVFQREVLTQADARLMSAQAGRAAKRRSAVCMAIFLTAMLVAMIAPKLGFGLICVALIPYMRPEWRLKAVDEF